MGRWIARILGVVLGIVVLAVGTIYALSERVINQRHPFREYPVAVPTDSASVAEGKRLVQMRCAGCHGDSLEGRADFFDEPNIARLVAPNVPQRLATMTDAEFAGFLRSGVRKDGTSPFVMPPPGFYHISDRDLGNLLAYLRSIPVPQNNLPANSYRIMGRLGVALGQFETAVMAMDTTQERVGQDTLWATTRKGEYLARMICTECHGPRLTGAAGEPAPAPSLVVVSTYSPEQFTALMRTGTPRDPATQLTLMAEVAQNSLKYMTDDEIAALYGYLRNLPPTGVTGSR